MRPLIGPDHHEMPVGKLSGAFDPGTRECCHTLDRLDAGQKQQQPPTLRLGKIAAKCGLEHGGPVGTDPFGGCDAIGNHGDRATVAEQPKRIRLVGGCRMEAACLVQHGAVCKHGGHAFLQAALLQAGRLQQAVRRDHVGDARPAGRCCGHPVGKLPNPVDVHDVVLRRQVLDVMVQFTAVPDRVPNRRRVPQHAHPVRRGIIDRLSGIAGECRQRHVCACIDHGGADRGDDLGWSPGVLPEPGDDVEHTHDA